MVVNKVNPTEATYLFPRLLVVPTIDDACHATDHFVFFIVCQPILGLANLKSMILLRAQRVTIHRLNLRHIERIALIELIGEMDKSFQLFPCGNFFNSNHRAKIGFYEIQRPKKINNNE